MGKILRHVLPPVAEALLTNYKEKRVFTSTWITFFFWYLTISPSKFHNYNSILLITHYILHPVHNQHAFKTLYNTVWVCSIVFHRFSSVQADQDSTPDSVCSRNPKKRDTAVDETQQLTEEARKMHLKNGMICGSQLVIFSGLFVLSMLNNSRAFHSQGRMEIICHFLVYSKLPLCINSQAALEKAINL